MPSHLARLQLKGPVKVRVRPGKAINRIVSFDDGVLLIEIAAKATDNKANLELVRFLSKELRRRVTIKNGHYSRDKIIIID